MMKIVFIVVSMLLSLGQIDCGEVERRGAFDVGSGSLKLLVADYNKQTKHIVKYVFSSAIPVPFSDQLAKSSDGTFDEEIYQKAKAAITELLEQAQPFSVERYYGVATEAFRLSKNGQEFADRIAQELNVHIRIIPQHEEASLGFQNAVEQSNGDPDNAVVWDIGGGSFQITWKEAGEYNFYMGSFGKVPMKNLIISDVQGHSVNEVFTPNPISKTDVDSAKEKLIDRLPVVTQNLRNKIQKKSTKVYGVGAIHNGNITKSTKKPIYSYAIVQDLIQSRIGLYDNEFDNVYGEGQHIYWLSDLLFVSTVMSHLGIENVINVKSFNDPAVEVPGNTAGIIINADYWQLVQEQLVLETTSS